MSFMADIYSKEKRSEIMSKIRSKDTKLEEKGRMLVREAGLAYRKHPKGIPGKPDVANKKRKIAIFFDSRFWHGYDYEKSIKGHLTSESWRAKIERNIERDAEVNQMLTESGWKVLRLWEHEISKEPEECVKRIKELMD